MSDKFKELVSCKDETFLSKIKRKIFCFFSKTKKSKNTENENNNIIIPEGISLFDKKDFFGIYEKIKNGEANLDELDEETTNKVIVMLDEEIALNSRKIEDQMRMIEISINKLKMSNSSLELLNKN